MVPVTSEDSEEEHAADNLPVPPGTSAIQELVIQQGPILKLRAENARLSMVEDRLEALEHAAAELARTTVNSPSTLARREEMPPGPARWVTATVSVPTSPAPPPSVTRVGGLTELLALPAPTQPMSHTQRLVESRHHKPHRRTTPQLPPSTQVTTEFLLDSALALQRQKGTTLFPHNFITRGDSGRKIGMGEATWAEYCVQA